jgi:ATP-dependent DNA helicase RecG
LFSLFILLLGAPTRGVLLKALDSVEEQHLPPLKLEEGENYFRVTMYAPRKFTQMSHSERLSACYQHAIAQYYKQQAMTNSTLRERFQLGEKQQSTVSKLIKEAQEIGLIKPKDPDNKSAKYIPSWA